MTTFYNIFAPPLVSNVFNFEKNRNPEHAKKKGTAKLPKPKKAWTSPVECAHSLLVC